MTVTFYLIYAIVALGPILLYLLKRRMNYWKDQGIPHETPSLLYGNFQGCTVSRNFYDVFKNTYEKFKGTGPFCGIYAFQKPGVVILDLGLVKNVLIKDFNNFVDRGQYYNEVDDPLTANLTLLDGQKWRKLRSKLSPTFTSAKMMFMYPTITKVAHQLVEIFGDMVEKSDSVEIKEMLARFTTDVIGTCAFGLECNSLKDPQAEFRLMGRLYLSDRPHPLKVGFMNTFPQISRKLHIRRVPRYLNDFFIKIVRDTVEYRRKNNTERNDFLNILMKLSNEKGDDKCTRGLSIEELAAQVFIFFIAGFETSSTTMGWALYEMALNHQIQDKLRAEVNDVLKKHNNDFTYECMLDMTYIDQVINETLRKYAVLPRLSRNAMNDYQVPGHPEYVIKKGMPVFIPVIGIHHDPEIYPNPELFDPERFSPEQVAQRDSVAFLGFGDGPRNCIAKRFGLMQSRIALAHLIKNFKFSRCKDTEVPPQRDLKQLVTTPKNGIHLKVERV